MLVKRSPVVAGPNVAPLLGIALPSASRSLSCHTARILHVGRVRIKSEADVMGHCWVLRLICHAGTPVWL